MKGFTLIEVIIVIVLLSIIAAIVVPNYVHWKEKEKTKTVEIVDTKRPSIMKSE